MTFSEPIVAGKTILQDIESEGFVSGSTGWTVKRDGDAEFNDVTVRGTVEVDGTDPDAHIKIFVVGGIPFLEFSDAAGNKYHFETSGNAALDIGPTTSPNSSLHFVRGEGIVLRSDATGAPSMLFDDDDGFIKHGSYSPWTESDWVAPTFSGTFTNFGAPFETIGYKKMPDGTVRFKGTGSRVGDTPDNTTMFTLNAGYRPANTVIMPVANASSIDAAAAHTGPALRVTSAGVVSLWGFGAVGTNTAFGLDGLSFSLI